MIDSQLLLITVFTANSSSSCHIIHTFLKVFPPHLRQCSLTRLGNGSHNTVPPTTWWPQCGSRPTMGLQSISRRFQVNIPPSWWGKAGCLGWVVFRQLRLGGGFPLPRRNQGPRSCPMLIILNRQVGLRALFEKYAVQLVLCFLDNEPLNLSLTIIFWLTLYLELW